MNGKILPIALGVAMILPAGGTVYRIGVLTVEWDWALKFAAAHVDSLPLALHGLSAMAFLALGALQVLPGFRAANPARHRRLGRWTASAGLVAAGTGVWMTLMHPEIATLPLFYARIIFGTAWAVFILLAVRAVLARNIARHRDFMVRAYAIALNAGTLPFLFFPLYLTLGGMTPALEDGVQVLGWIVNLAVAEWIIRRKPRRRKMSKLQTA